MIWVFVFVQAGIMLLAISDESLWIDEFWTAHFATVESLRKVLELILVPSGSQTPLHFIYYYFWGLFTEPSEFLLRLANLPLFVVGQLSLFVALRSYPRRFGYLLLAVSALHPMVWQYANEARPYIMMYAGSEMLLAYILNMHAIHRKEDRVGLLFSAMFVVGAILLFGASLLGVFWVFAAGVYVAYFHYQRLNWRYLTRGLTLLLVCILLATATLLTIYYLRSLVMGAGGARIASTTASTLLFAVYELLGLSGIGPSRLQLRDAGVASLGQHMIWLIAAGGILLVVVAKGWQEATRILRTRELVVVLTLALFPLVIVILAGFAMHWRVLGRHLIAAIPLLNLLFALGLAKLFDPDVPPGRVPRSMVAVSFLLLLAYSSLSLRFAERHKKDDYRTAAAIALQGVAQGKRVWWAADSIGANYYGLPGEFDVMGELTGVHRLPECVDRPGVRSIANASKECLQMLASPDVVILSKPETFDMSGEIVEYLRVGNFVNTQGLPAFTIWQPTGRVKQGEK